MYIERMPSIRALYKSASVMELDINDYWISAPQLEYCEDTVVAFAQSLIGGAYREIREIRYAIIDQDIKIAVNGIMVPAYSQILAAERAQPTHPEFRSNLPGYIM